ncbi:4543_t:CDS:1, partial [Ambispora gerdemannii]
ALVNTITPRHDQDPQLFENDPDTGLTETLQSKETTSSLKRTSEPTPEICSKCSETIFPGHSKPVVLLTCKHVIHFECIGNKRNLCPKCSSTDDLEKEGYYISPDISVNEAFKKKRKRQEDNTHENKPKESQNRKTLFELLVVPIFDEPSITVPSEEFNMEEISNKFHRLYYEVDDIEKKGDRTNREVFSV